MLEDVSRSAQDSWQCPWSKVFPHLYEDCNKPCATHSFADFKDVNEHTWRYHSYLLSCPYCDFRFSEAPRAEKNRDKLEQIKIDHLQKFHSMNVDKGEEIKSGGKGKAQKKGGPPKRGQTKSKDAVETMTPEQDERFRVWQSEYQKRGTIKLGLTAKYQSLCECLFGSDITLPNNLNYNYRVLEHKQNPSSEALGKKNLAIVKGRMTRLDGAQEQLTLSAHDLLAPPPPGDLHSLDDHGDTVPVFCNWSIPKGSYTNDSGYGSANMLGSQVTEMPENQTQDSSLFTYMIDVQSSAGDASVDCRDLGTPSQANFQLIDDDIMMELKEMGSEHSGGPSS